VTSAASVSGLFYFKPVSILSLREFEAKRCQDRHTSLEEQQITQRSISSAYQEFGLKRPKIIIVRPSSTAFPKVFETASLLNLGVADFDLSQCGAFYFVRIQRSYCRNDLSGAVPTMTGSSGA